MATGKVLVFGGTRGTGLEVVRALGGAGVTVAVRPTSDTTALEAAGASAMPVNVFDPESVRAALADGAYRALVLSLSGQRGEARRADREGAKCIIDAALVAGIERMLMVTAIGCGDSRPAVAPKVIEVLGEVLAAKTDAEAYLQQSGLAMTILRPGGLTDDAATGTAIKTTDHSAMGVATRADVGRLVAECIDDAATIGEIYHTIDPEITWQAPLQRGEDIPAGKS